MEVKGTSGLSGTKPASEPEAGPPTGLLCCLFLRLLEMIFVISEGREELVHFDGAAWVSLRVMTSMLQQRYTLYKYSQKKVLSMWFDSELLVETANGNYEIVHRYAPGGYVQLSRGLFKKIDQDGKQKTHVFDVVAARLMKLILAQMSRPVNEDCPIRTRSDRLKYETPLRGAKTKGLYFLQLGALFNFTGENGHFVCAKVGKSEVDMGKRVFDESSPTDLGKFGKVVCRFYLPFKDSTPKNILDLAEDRLLFHVYRIVLSFPFRKGFKRYRELLQLHPNHFGLVRECFYLVAHEFDEYVLGPFQRTSSLLPCPEENPAAVDKMTPAKRPRDVVGDVFIVPRPAERAKSTLQHGH